MLDKARICYLLTFSLRTKVGPQNITCTKSERANTIFTTMNIQLIQGTNPKHFGICLITFKQAADAFVLLICTQTAGKKYQLCH